MRVCSAHIWARAARGIRPNENWRLDEGGVSTDESRGSHTDMGYIDKNLVPGEMIAYRTGCHWVVMFWPLIGGAVLGFVGFAFFAGGWMATRNGGRYEGAMVWGALALLGAIALIGGGIIRRFATEVAVSNQHVLIKTGLLSRRSVEVLLPKVESIGVDEPFLGRLLGYGSVI